MGDVGVNSFFNLKDKIKSHFSFTAGEVRGIIITSLIIGFVAGFDDGTKVSEAGVDYGFFVLNMMACVIIAILSILVHHSVQRIVALWHGFKLTHKMSMPMSFTGVMLAIMSLGKIVFIPAGGFHAEMLPQHRLGSFRYGLSFGPLAVIAFFGSLSNIILAIIFKMLAFIPSPFIAKAMMINLIFAISNLLPIPPLDGSQIFFVTRFSWAFMFGTAVALALFLPRTPLLLTIVTGLGIGILFTIYYKVGIETKL
jgi:Zn-dependent protease